MKTVTAFCTLLVGFTLSVFAQQTYSISGRVVQPNDEQAVQSATVLLIDAEESSPKGLITDEKGRFRFQEVAPGTYELKVTFAGYENVSRQLTLKDQNLALGDLVLGEKIYDLEEVVIEGQEAIAEQRGDTVEYNASAFKTNPDASAGDLVQKMPGVVMENGQIKAQGETVERVLVDGKVFFGEDPNAALQNLPAEVVKSVQVLDQQSDQAQFTGFEDGETTKTINIVTKPNKRVGKFGRVQVGFGQPDNRYLATGSINLFNGDQRITLLGLSNNVNQQNFSQQDLVGVGGGEQQRWGRRRGSDFLVNGQGGITTTQAFGINFSDDWGENIEVSGSYFFNYADNYALTEVNRDFLLDGDIGQVYEEVSDASRQNYNHRFNARIEYKINDYNEIRIRPSLRYQDNRGLSVDSGRTSLGTQLVNDFLNQSESDLNGFSLSNNITYQHKFNDAGRSISIELDTDYDNDAGNRDLYSKVNYYAEATAPDSINQTSIRNSNEWDIELEVEFNEPIGEWGRFELEYELNPRVNDASTRTLAFNPIEGQYTRLDTALSNEFFNTYTRHELGTGLRISLDSGRFVGNVTVGYQLARLNNDQTFPNELTTRTDFGGLVSRAYARWEISDDQNFRFYYRGSTDPPNITQLQDVVDNSNPLQLRTGNPALDQSYRHFGVLRYSSTNTANSSNFYVVARGSVTQNFVANSTYIAEGESRVVNGIALQPGAQLTLPVNLDNYIDLSSTFTYGIQVEALKLNVNTELSTDYTRIPSLINERANYSNNYRLGLGLTLSSNISEKVDFTISSRANMNQVVNTLREELNSQFYSQNSFARVNLIFWKGLVFRSQLTHQLFTGLADGFNQSFWLWNASIGKKMFKNQLGEVSISVFDALRQNTSIQRNVTSTYIEDVRELVLQRYFMLNFTYRFRKFSGGSPEREGRGGYGRGGRRRW